MESTFYAVTEAIYVDLDKIPTACGNDRYCYQYDSHRDKWMSAGRVNHGRKYPSYSCHPMEGLIMVGGGHNHYEQQDSVESTKDGHDFETNYPPMPLRESRTD